MQFFKPILTFSLEKTQSSIQLSSSNEVLQFQVINNHSTVSSLGSASIDLHQKSQGFSNFQNKRYLPYSPESIKQLKLQSSQSQNQIHIETVKRSNYWEILEKCRVEKVKFTDLQFPAENKSLGNQKYLSKQLKFFGWKRISQIVPNALFKDDKIEAKDALQGAIGDCYLMSSMAVIAQDYPILFQKIFARLEYSQQGIYMARFSIQGILVQIVIDDYIPVDKNGQPIYAKVSKGNEIWPIVLQKCWAKLFKSYQIIQAGSPRDVLHALTGAPYRVIYLNPNIDVQMKRQQFRKTQTSQQRGSVFCCQTTDKQIDKKKYDQKGLIVRHAYSVLQLYTDPICIAKIRNPYGSNHIAKGELQPKKYKYAWKDKMKQHYEQKSQVYLQKLKTDLNIDVLQPQVDGQFYMHFDQFMTEFQSLTSCDIYQGLNLLSIRSNFMKNKAQLFYFDIKKRTPVVISMGQRHKKMEKYNPHIDTETYYAVTSLVLAHQIKKSDFKQRNSAKQQKQLQATFQYQFLGACSNPPSNQFNFITFQEKQLDIGRYIIYCIANVRLINNNSSVNQSNRDFTITVKSMDTSFPQKIQLQHTLFVEQSKDLFNFSGLFQKQINYQWKFLEQVFLNKIYQDFQIETYSLKDFETIVHRSNNVNSNLTTIQKQKISPSNSWVSMRFPFQKNQQQLGGFGYFACHLQQNHPQKQIFSFNKKKYLRGFIQIWNQKLGENTQDFQFQLLPGQTKIIIMKLMVPPSGDQFKLYLHQNKISDWITIPIYPTRLTTLLSKSNSLKSNKN